MARGNPGSVAVPIRDGVPGVLPALVLESGLLVSALVGHVAVALEIGVLVDPLERGPGLELESGPAWCPRSTARTRRGGRRRGGWRPRCRSTGSGGAPRTRSSRRSGVRGGSAQGPRPGSRRAGSLSLAQGAKSVVAASSGANGNACKLVRMLSRPNSVMNQGRPAAGSARPGRYRRKAQCRQVNQASLVRGFQRVPRALQTRRPGQPLVDSAGHGRPLSPGVRLVVIFSAVRRERSGHRTNFDLGGPTAMGLEMDGEPESRFLDRVVG